MPENNVINNNNNNNLDMGIENRGELFNDDVFEESNVNTEELCCLCN